MNKKLIKNNYLLFLLIFSFSFISCTTNTAKMDNITEKQQVIASESLDTLVPSNKLTEPIPRTALSDSALEIPDVSDINDNQLITGLLTIHFIDVGQADSILVQLPNDEIMLIDAGNNGDANTILKYLGSLGISQIDYLIGTHPHEDHVGSLDSVINTFDIENIYMPKATSNTKTFEDVLLAIENKNLKINTAKAGINLFDFHNLKADFLAPNNAEYSDLNNYSAVIKLTYGNTSFMFTGDAESLSENEILSSYSDLKSDVLKIGHHGSDSSTTDYFISAINPSYAVISCGVDNTYGHPSSAILERLHQYNISVYRTDLQGTIIIKSDGEKINIDKDDLEYSVPITPSTPEPTTKTTDAPTPEPEKETKSITVYVTKTGEKYHSSGCQYLSKSKISIDLESAKDSYSACSRCSPQR